MAWTAGTWVLAYNARIEALEGRAGQVTPRLQEDAHERLRRAGA
ncbi:MAG: hypothetical protein O3C25_01300 [Chloroflexi bacterium]|nr:hypothetical protein [Chloroflexota bacterium]